MDLIWVGPLFTHLDKDRTRRWLRDLCERLNPNGVLAASFHGEWRLSMQRIYPMIDPASWERIVDQYRREGDGYAPYPDWPAGEYGISLSSPQAILRLIRQIPGVRLAGYVERGWADNHDIAIIGKEDREHPWTPEFRSRR